MPPVLTRNGDALELALSGCRGSEFQDAKEKIKEIPGRRFDFERKLWIVPSNPQNAERILKTIRPEVADDLMNWITESRASHEESLTSPIPDDDPDLLIPWAYKRCPWQPEYVNDEKFDGLLDYQRAAVGRMSKRGRAILADDMGLGKSFEAISAVEEYRARNGEIDGPKLVIAPASVKGGWKRELERWLEDPVVVIVDGSTPAKRAKQIADGVEQNAWIICNWEQLRVKKEKKKLRNGGSKTVTVMKEPLFEETEWLAVIGDEAHRAKNRKSQQTMGAWRIDAKLLFALTGTPIMNSPDELWSILRWLWPTEYHEQGARRNAIAFWPFYEQHVDYWEDHFGRKVVTGVKNPDALRFSLKDKLIRRTASILGLKGRKRFYFPVDLTPGQQKLYAEAEKAMWLAVEKDIAAGNQEALAFARAATESGSATQLFRIPNGAARMVRLLQIIENPALLGGDDDSAIMDDFEQRYTDSRPYPWVVFCKYRESCDILAERLRNKHGANVGIYTGNVPARDRTALEDEFQRGELDVLVGTIDAMYQGITLTRGHLQYWLSRDFVPAKNEQGEARQDRLGQQELVRVYIPQPPNTVASDKVDPINRLKEKIVATVIPMDEIKEELNHV